MKKELLLCSLLAGCASAPGMTELQAMKVQSSIDNKITEKALYNIYNSAVEIKSTQTKTEFRLKQYGFAIKTRSSQGTGVVLKDADKNECYVLTLAKVILPEEFDSNNLPNIEAGNLNVIISKYDAKKDLALLKLEECTEPYQGKIAETNNPTFIGVGPLPLPQKTWFIGNFDEDGFFKVPRMPISAGMLGAGVYSLEPSAQLAGLVKEIYEDDFIAIVHWTDIRKFLTGTAVADEYLSK